MGAISDGALAQKAAVSETPPAAKERPLARLLEEAVPSWTLGTAALVFGKLAEVGLATEEALREALAGGWLNDLLRGAGRRALSAETVGHLQRYFGGQACDNEMEARTVEAEDEALWAECEARGFPLQHLAAAAPEELRCILCEAERLEACSLEGLRAECQSHGFAAAGRRTAWGEQEELAEVLVNIFIWKRMELPSLQQVCRERGLSITGNESSRVLLAKLAEASWEDQGLPTGAFHSAHRAQQLLDKLRELERRSWNKLRDTCLRRRVPFSRVMGKGKLVSLLKFHAVWKELPTAFQRSECERRNLRVRTVGGGALLDLLVESMKVDALEVYELPPSLLLDPVTVSALYQEMTQLEGLPLQRLEELWVATAEPLVDCPSMPHRSDHKQLIRGLLLLNAWRSLLSTKQLRSLCLSEGVVDAESCEACSKLALMGRLLERSLVGEWEARGIPAARLGLRAAAALAGKLAEIEAEDFHQLRRRYCSSGLLYERKLERREYVRCLQWLATEEALAERRVQDGASTSSHAPRLADAICGSRDIPQGRLGGGFSAVVRLARRYDSLARMGMEDLSAECEAWSVPFEATPSTGELCQSLQFRSLLQAFAWEELLVEYKGRGINTQEESREALEHRCLLDECLGRFEAKGLPARELGSVGAVVALADRLQELESMPDSQLKEKYLGLGLLAQDIDREVTILTLKQWEVWQSLPFAELQRECQSSGAPPGFTRWCRLQLQEWLLLDMAEEAYRRRGVPAKRLGSLEAATGLSGHFSRLEALEMDSLVERCREVGIPIARDATRELLVGRLKHLAVWDALSEDELRVECHANALPEGALRTATRRELRGALLLRACRGDFEARGVAVRSVGPFEACASLARALDEIDAMTDSDVRQKYRALGLAPERSPRARLVRRLRQVERWAAGPLKELQKVCRERRVNTIASSREQSRELAKRLAQAMWKDVPSYSCLPEELPEERPSEDDLKFLQRRFYTFLPQEGWTWSWWEAVLFFQSRGSFHPERWAAKRRAPPQPAPPRGPRAASGCISVAVITSEARHHLHPQVWKCFTQQTWPEKELVVVDTWNEKPSPFFSSLEDERLVYVSIQESTPHSFSLGLKRNMCVHLASGAYVAHFDDDDIYAPRYLATMLDEMCQQGWEAITLRNWYIYDIDTGRFGHLDPRKQVDPDSPADLDSWEYGFGFSYMYTREVATRIPYSDQSFEADAAAGEDWPFFQRIRQSVQEELGCLRGFSTYVLGMRVEIPGPEGVALLSDDLGLCLHVMHGGNLATVGAHRQVPPEEVAVLEVQELEGLDAMLQGYALPGGGRAPSSHGGLVPERRERRLQDLSVRSEVGECRLQLPAGSTVEDLRSCFCKHLKWSQLDDDRCDTIDFYYSCPAAGKPWEAQALPLQDGERIPLRTKELWAAV